jgi:hypothetical protein
VMGAPPQCHLSTGCFKLDTVAKYPFKPASVR